MALNPATLFPIPPDPNFGVTYSHDQLTDVQTTLGGVEVRASLLEYASRQLDYTVSNFNDAELARFRATWINATERLRYFVPIWCEQADASNVPDAHTVLADLTDLDFVAGQPALLWIDEDTYQQVTVDTLSSSQFTTVEAINAAFLGRPIQAYPIMTAWLIPPDKDIVASDAEHVTVSFEEEPPQIAGLDATIGNWVLADGTLFVTTLDRTSSGWAGLRFQTRSFFVFDASGQRILNPDITYTISPIAGILLTDPGVRVTFPNNRQQVHAEYSYNNPAFQIHAVYGALTMDVYI